MKKSGQELGEENIARLRAYFDSVDTVPSRGGKAHVTAIAIAAGVDRQVLYKNPNGRQLLEEAIANKGLVGISSRGEQEDVAVAKLEKRVTELEQKNASLVAENWQLRRDLSRLRHVEAMLEDGKRVIA